MRNKESDVPKIITVMCYSSMKHVIAATLKVRCHVRNVSVSIVSYLSWRERCQVMQWVSVWMSTCFRRCCAEDFSWVWANWMVYVVVVWSLQLENVGSVSLQFSWQIITDNFTDVKTGATPTTGTVRPSTAETPRPASITPLIVRPDDASNIRPSSALSSNITVHLMLL